MPAALVALAGAGYVYYDAQEQTGALEEQVKDLQVQLSGKTNSAFVFIKPHACKGTPGKVEAVVEDKFRASGIRVTGKGMMTADQIDKNMYIDTHYGAIASKAVKLKPSELNVPDKGKAGFEKMFGESWDAAIKAGKVYNAKDAAEKLGLDASGINKKWSTLTSGKDLIKFGGGFYCGKVGDIYVMNGFYMSMRAGRLLSVLTADRSLWTFLILLAFYFQNIVTLARRSNGTQSRGLAILSPGMTSVGRFSVLQIHRLHLRVLFAVQFLTSTRS
jgi:hypothetical protein